jgi:hypothetical protein
MNSGGHRGFTVVTVVTLVFAPVFSHHHWMWKLVGKSKETHLEKCVVRQPCPKRKRVVNIVTLPQPPAPAPAPGKGKKHDGDDDKSLVDDPRTVDPGGDD